MSGAGEEKGLTLFFMRHAKAEERDTALYRDDSQRPLSDAGVKQIKEAAAGLKREGVRIDRIYSSPYVRARQTADITAQKIGFTGKIIFKDALCPGAEFAGLRGLIDLCPDDEKVLFVGHEPAISRFVSMLLTGGPDMPMDFKTAALCRLHVTQRSPLRTELKWFMTARLMKNL